MTYSIAVVAHNSRADAAHMLGEQVGAAYTSIDDGILGATGNHRKVWTWLAEHATTEWSVVVEDDAIPTARFNSQLGEVLTVAPTPIVGLYLGAGYPPQWQARIRAAITEADRTGASWITGQLLYGVGVAIQTPLIEDMLTYTEKSTQGFDFAIKDWATARSHTIGFTWPSLLDHQDSPSIAKHPDGGQRLTPRKAYKVGGRGTWTNRQVAL